MIQTLKKLFYVSRPISWVNTAYPFAAGYLVLGGAIDAIFVIGTIFFLIPYNLLMYGVNDVFDYESDMQNPRKGSIEGAKETKAFHPTILWAATLSTLPFVAALFLLGNRVANIVLALVLFFVVAYSIKGLRFKEKPILDSVTSSIHFVGPLVYALALLYFPEATWPYVIAFFLWGMASHAFGAVQDVVPDRTAKIASIATVLGARLTVWFALLLYAASCVIVAWQGGVAWVVATAGVLYIVNIIPYVGVTDKTSVKANKGWRRFIWLNLFAGAVVTLVLILA